MLHVYANSEKWEDIKISNTVLSPSTSMVFIVCELTQKYVKQHLASSHSFHDIARLQKGGN